MSPIIEAQKRLVEVGRIRAGEKGPKGEPRKLTNWRLTSRDRLRLEAAAGLWGGEVREWADHAGEFELYTETNALPIALMPDTVPSSWFELWSKGGCQRRCDGVHELMSDSSCLCGEERECSPVTRLSVLLPDVPGIGSWLLASSGWNAAVELAGSVNLLQGFSHRGELVPARLRLEQRSTIRAGRTHRFVCPVIDVDVALREYITPRNGSIELPAAIETTGFVPVPQTMIGPTLGEGLADVEALEPREGPKSPPPIAETEFEVEPVAVEAEGDLPPAEEEKEDESSKPLSKREANRKMDAIVGQLREDGTITTEQLWARVASMRRLKVEDMIALIPGARDEDGVLHWGPLRDSLELAEARELHSRLAGLWNSVRPQPAET